MFSLHRGYFWEYLRWNENKTWGVNKIYLMTKKNIFTDTTDKYIEWIELQNWSEKRPRLTSILQTLIEVKNNPSHFQIEIDWSSLHGTVSWIAQVTANPDLSLMYKPSPDPLKWPPALHARRPYLQEEKALSVQTNWNPWSWCLNTLIVVPICTDDQQFFNTSAIRDKEKSKLGKTCLSSVHMSILWDIGFLTQKPNNHICSL